MPCAGGIIMDSNNMYQNQSTGSVEPNQQPTYNTVGNDGYNSNSYNGNNYGNDIYNNNGGTYSNNGYNGAYNYGGNFNNGGIYTQPAYQSEMEEPVSVGEWIITMLIMIVHCVNIVMMFIWAFGSSSKKSKSNYFKAGLIITGIVLALYLILVIFVVVAGVTLSR